MLSAPVLALVVLAAPPVDPADVDRYLQITGFASQLKQTPELVLAGFDQTITQSGAKTSADPQVLAGIRKAIPKVYAVDRLVAEIRANVVQSIDPQSLSRTLEWYRGALAVKMSALEAEAATPKAQDAIQAYGTTLKTTPAPAARLELVRKLDKAVQATEAALNQLEGTTRGVITAVQALRPKKERLDAMQLARQLGELRSKKRPVVEGLVLTTGLYTYKTLTDAELRQAAAFYSSPAGASVIATCNQAATAAYRMLALELAEATR